MDASVAELADASNVLAGLRERQHEIEIAVLERVRSIVPVEVADSEYVDGLREAVMAAVEFGLVAAGDEGDSPPVPPALIAQVRRAARAGVSLDAVLRRYIAGFTMLGEFIVREGDAESSPAAGELSRLLRAVTAGFDRIVASVTKEYKREAEKRLRATDHALAEQVRRLLGAELLETPQLNYRIGGRWHVAAVACGPGGPAALRRIGARLDRALLLVRPDQRTAWAWLGGECRPCDEDAAVELLASSLQELYLAPLARDRDDDDGVALWARTSHHGVRFPRRPQCSASAGRRLRTGSRRRKRGSAARSTVARPSWKRRCV